MSHIYAIARQLQSPGVQTIAIFSPARLGKTLRNMTRKSIATGKHNGGYSSKSRDVRNLVFKLAGEKPIVFSETYADYMSFVTPRPITRDNLSEMLGLLEADCTLQKMQYDDMEKSRYTPPREHYYKTIDERHELHITRLKYVEHGKASHLIVRTAKLRQQLAEVFLRERTIEEIAIAERIARLLDEDREWDVPTTHEF